ncbi:hypothetical protein CBER1_09838 [Cercospora berteroae]|uniref:Heterokaryon incompatibility domain-containing protein n=1 Tax=Cercospora berteroae TaxID=357750 RepID=A0A2S6BY14_9PEZI|nr:hypothetical protein CBER1_09838 [Cercospora berteroae]
MEPSANHQISSQIYSPLDSSKQEHRLLRFVGGKRSLAWELGTFSLLPSLQHGHPPMIALSYCWGRAAADKPITLNGHEFLVRQNLYDFLVQMASENRRDWFFVDAICINQDDVPERSVQVTYMGRIYRIAEEVIAWIYFEDTDDPKVMKQGDIQAHVREYQLLEKEKQQSDQDLAPEERHLLESLQQMAWQLAASSSYWSRLWIVQELLLAPNLTIRWSSLTFHWKDIMSLRIRDVDIPSVELDPSTGRPLRPHQLTTMRKAGLFTYEHLPNSAENSIMCKQLWHWKDSAGQDLQKGKLLKFHEAVAFFSIQQCGVMHDNVYALLGIAECAIKPDYDMPLMDLYTAALYNYLLSLWSVQRSGHDGKTAIGTRDWDTLIDLGLDYNKLLAPGETFLHAFQLDPFHDLVFLMTYEVCKRFSEDATLLATQGLAANWLFHTESTKLEVGAANDLVKRKWYESEDRALKRFDKDLMARVEKANERLEKLKRKDGALEAPHWGAPIKAPASDGRTKTCSEWASGAKSLCDNVWTRWSQAQ